MSEDRAIVSQELPPPKTWWHGMPAEDIAAVADLMRSVDAYAYDYLMAGKGAPSRFSTERDIATAIRTAVEAAILKERGAAAQATQVPTVEKGSQDWAAIDGAVAFHLIERHADNWADAGQMMDEWAEAQAPKYAAIRSRTP